MHRMKRQRIPIRVHIRVAVDIASSGAIWIVHRAIWARPRNINNIVVKRIVSASITSACETGVIPVGVKRVVPIPAHEDVGSGRVGSSRVVELSNRTSFL